MLTNYKRSTGPTPASEIEKVYIEPHAHSDN